MTKYSAKMRFSTPRVFSNKDTALEETKWKYVYLTLHLKISTLKNKNKNKIKISTLKKDKLF